MPKDLAQGHSLGITPHVMTRDLTQGHSFFQNDHMCGSPEQHAADPPLIWQEITKLGGSDICLEMSYKKDPKLTEYLRSKFLGMMERTLHGSEILVKLETGMARYNNVQCGVKSSW
jgi:hypothetical protein